MEINPSFSALSIYGVDLSSSKTKTFFPAPTPGRFNVVKDLMALLDLMINCTGCLFLFVISSILIPLLTVQFSPKLLLQFHLSIRQQNQL